MSLAIGQLRSPASLVRICQIAEGFVRTAALFCNNYPGYAVGMDDPILKTCGLWKSQVVYLEEAAVAWCTIIWMSSDLRY